MPGSTTLDTDVSLSGIDLEAAIPCDLRRDDDAAWHAFGRCPSCGMSEHTLVCDRCMKALTSAAPTRCRSCNYSGPAKKFFTKTFRL